MDRLKGKRALLTACGAGIGRAAAQLFAAEGAYVIATSRSLGGMADLKDQGIAETHALDVRDTEAVNALVDRLGPIDVLFNCAGAVHHGTVLDTSEEDWDEAFDVRRRSVPMSAHPSPTLQANCPILAPQLPDDIALHNGCFPEVSIVCKNPGECWASSDFGNWINNDLVAPSRRNGHRLLRLETR